MTAQPNPRTLTEMQRYGTAYEVAVTAGDVTIRLAFTERRTKWMLLGIAQQHGSQVLALIGDDTPVDDVTYAKATGWTFGPAQVHFTGRTERDVASAMSLI